MKKIIVVLALLVFGIGTYAEDFNSYVNPIIGTSNHGHVAVGANVPFGMVLMGPMQTGEGWDWCSGYDYSDNTIQGFSPLHLSGTGCSDLGDVQIMPMTERKGLDRYFSTYKHEDEVNYPGYYSVLLSSGIKAEMTATCHVAFQRYTYPKQDKVVSVNLRDGAGDKCKESWVTKINEYTITGLRRSEGWAHDHKVFFVLKFSEPINTFEVSGDNMFAQITFKKGNAPLLSKLAISATSVEAANKNLEAELKDWDFEGTTQKAYDVWNERLGLIKATFMNDVDRTIFYTAMYHMLYAPICFSDVDGSYYGSDGKNHNNPSYTNYTIWSCWDTYRSFHPLATLLLPDMQKDWAISFVNIAREQGFAPIWHLCGNETWCMPGISSVPIISDICLKGYMPDSLLEEAYQLLKKTMKKDLWELTEYNKYGYVTRKEGESVSRTMEYCLDDWSVAQVAKKLGYIDDYKFFYNRSLNYKLLYDKQIGYMRSLDSNGKFLPIKGFDPRKQTRDYSEGTPWQYLWLVPHDVNGLVKLIGGKKKFISKLDSLFLADPEFGENAQLDIAGLIGQYAQGNEPSHHIPYLYNYVGCYDKTCKIIRQITTTLYADGKDGLPGNEDVGQMSAWYILAALGLYQVEPCGGVYQLACPLVKEATVKMPDGQLIIKTHNNNRDKYVVKKVCWNGKVLKKRSLNFEQLVKGGTLEFYFK